MNKRRDIDLILRRELLASRKEKRALTLCPIEAAREIKLDPDIKDAGAIQLDINDIIPTVDAYGVGLPPGTQIIHGVVGDEVWPISADDVEMEEIEEVAALSEQTLTFDKLTTNAYRAGLKVNVSNLAIDNAAFPLVDYIRKKADIATRKYLSRHFYSCEEWAGNKGPFVNADTVDVSENLAESIIAELKRLTEAGFDMSTACVVVDPLTEIRLKLTPVKSGAGRYIIENDLCLGYPYVVNKYFGTKKDEDGQLEPYYDQVAIGIGVFNWFSVAQHAGGRLIIDGLTLADRNITTININTWWSFTNLADKMTEHAGKQGTAFRILEVASQLLADHSDFLLKSSDGYLFRVNKINPL